MFSIKSRLETLTDFCPVEVKFHGVIAAFWVDVDHLAGVQAAIRGAPIGRVQLQRAAELVPNVHLPALQLIYQAEYPFGGLPGADGCERSG